MRYALLFILAFVLLVAHPPAQSQGLQCYDRQPVTTVLRNEHGESPAYRGILADGSLIEVWTSEGGGTFTMFMVPPASPTLVCPLMDGGSWQPSPAMKGTGL